MITVKVSGPGRCFDKQYYAVRQALLDTGVTLYEVNEYPGKDKTVIRHGEIPSEYSLNDVMLIANHCPWGG